MKLPWHHARDWQRAQLLQLMADGAACGVAAVMPRAAWPTLVQGVVQKLSAASNCPTRDLAALERAACVALAKLNKLPSA